MTSTVFYYGQTDYITLLNKLWDRVASVASLVDGASINVNIAADERVFDVTLGGNRTLTASGGAASLDGKIITLRITQGTGNNTLTIGSGLRLGADLSSITLSTTAGKTDYLGCIYNHAAGKLDVIALARGY